jgi:hypothetical protein
MGSMNSSNKISPGVGLEMESVIIDDLDISRTSLRPNKADPPLLVDPDGMLAEAVVPQRLEPVVGRNREVVKHFGVVQHAKLA